MKDNKNFKSLDRRAFLKRSAGLGVSAAALQFAYTPRLFAHGSFEAGPVVETTEGKVRGLLDGKVNVFRGLRYGAATAGDRRFLPPQKPPAFAGVWEAFEFGPMCPQFNPAEPRPMTDFFYPVQLPNIPEDEDCLRLNIYTPSLSAAGKLPVMVWLHGGGFSSGAASMPIFHAEGLAGFGAVVVTINHRLNVFGYTMLDDVLGDEFTSSGNAGILDIVQALSWVRDNISAFGGDPGNVTIFGESGGGGKVSCVMAMPAAKGLFHRAIIESGPGLTMTTREAAARATQALLDAAQLKAGQGRDLQKLTNRELLTAMFTAQRSLGGGPGGGGFQPVIDDPALPRHPFTPDAPEISASVPLLIGTNLHEVSFFTRTLQPNPGINMDEAGLKASMANFPIPADEAIATYRRVYPDATPYEISVLATSDTFFRQNSLTLAERKARQGGAAVYMYRFDWETDMLGGGRGAMHTLELPFVFNNLDKNRWLTGKKPGDQRLADRMSRAWVAFARTGNPNATGLPDWPAYETGSRSTMIFNDRPTVVDDPAGEIRMMLAKVMN